MNKEKEIPSLIGITDVASAEDAALFLRMLSRYGLSQAEYKLHVGVMTSHKMLAGRTTKWRDIWPDPNEISSIFVEHPLVVNYIHYANYDEVSVKQLLRDLTACVDVGGRNLTGIQLDVPWPSAAVLHEVRRHKRNLHIIIQISRQIFKEFDNDEVRISEKLKEYRGLAEYVLLDGSGGEGIPMDPHELVKYASVINQEHPQFKIIMAGGLGLPETNTLMQYPFRIFPGVSTDAQRNLHKDCELCKPLDMEKVETYIEAMCDHISDSEAWRDSNRRHGPF